MSTAGGPAALSEQVVLTIGVVGSLVFLVWTVCFIYVRKFMQFRNQNGHGGTRMGALGRSGDIVSGGSGKGGKGGGKNAIGVSGRNIKGVSTATSYEGTQYLGGGATSYGGTTTAARYGNQTAYGATTMMSGSTTMVTTHELSIPGFLLVQTNTDYLIGKIIARGGAGVIYVATALSPPLVQRTGGYDIVAKGFGDSLQSMEEDYRNAFYQELSLMWRFNQHDSFVKVFGYSETPAVILMKFYRFGSLADFIHGAGQVSQEYYYTKRGSIRLFSGLCRAIGIMHLAGYVHCDIKPGNVLLDTDQNNGLKPVLSDFGICQIVDPTVLRVKAFRVSQAIGASICYAAPEILEFLRSGQALKADENLKKGDIYALGCLLYEVLERRVPWR